MLNRSAMIVRPLQPYKDWALGLDDSGPEPDSDDPTVYLVSEIEIEGDKEAIVREVFSEVFERELFAWDTNESNWPKDRSLKVFKDWFKLEFHSMVDDLGTDTIKDDDEDE